MIETLIEYPNGGKIDVYTLVDKTASDYKNITACCDFFAMQGNKTLIAPRFGETIGNPLYEQIYASLKNTKYWGRCPAILPLMVFGTNTRALTLQKISAPHKKNRTRSVIC